MMHALQPLRVLILEDRPSDAELVVDELRQAGFEPEWRRVDTEADYLAHLDPPPDIIIADYSLPQWDAPHALRALQERGLDVPFIMVSGTVGEDVAVECIKQGAADYLLKDRLARLGPAVVKALDDRRLRAEKRQAEEELKRLKEFNENIVQTMAEGIALQDAEGSFTFVNPAAAAIMGYTPWELVGQPWTAVIPPDQHAIIRAADERRKRGTTDRYEVDLVRKDGTRRTVFVSGGPLFEEGRFVGTMAVFTDITERKGAEEALRASEERLRNVLENMPVMLDALDENLNIIIWNRECERVTGYSADEIVHHPNVSELLYPDPHYREGMQAELVASDDYRDWEWETTCKDGSVKTVAWFNISRQYPVPGWARWGIGVDITERKQAQLSEREQRVLAEALADTATVLNSTLDLEALMTTILANVARVVPHDAANIMLIEQDQAYIVYWRGYRPEQIPHLREFRMPLAQTPNLQQMSITGLPYLIPHVDQDLDWVRQPLSDRVKSHVAAPIRSHGQVIGFLNLDSAVPGFFTEIHAQRLQAFADQASLAIEHTQLYEEIRRYAGELEQRVEERTAELNRARERVETILNSSSDMIILVRPNKTIDQVNPVFDRTFAYENDEIFGQPLAILTTPDDSDILEAALDGVLEDRQPRRIEIAARGKNGTTFDADLMLSPIVQEGNRIIGIVCSLRDITERKQLEAKLRQTLEREMQLGELRARFVSMASHEFRNPLASIQLSADLLGHYSDRLPEERKKKELDQIRLKIKNMTELLDDVLLVGTAEAGKLRFEPKALDIREFCESILIELQRTIGADHKFVFFSEGHCGPATMDPKLLRHILGNLLSNAIKYSPAGSTITFDLICENHQALFRIKDMGIGIPEKDQVRLFETFHRAGNVGNIPGTGLGLAIVKQSVDLHGGRIELQSEKGQGSTFTVYLPLSDLGDTRGE
jgi:PAS domain S-box-containing protein